jgi:hypothetical protein
MGHKAYVGHCRDDGLVKLPLQPLLDDLHVQHAQEPAAEAKAQRLGGLQFVGQGGVVELQLVHAIPEFFEIIGFDRENTRKDHGLYLLEALDHFLRGIGGEGDGIPYPYFLGILDPGDNIAYIACPYFGFGGQR